MNTPEPSAPIDLQKMAADIQTTATLSGAPADAAAIRSTLEHFAYGFGHFPVEFRLTDKPEAQRELAFRFVDLTGATDPVPIAREAGALGDVQHPVARLVPELQARLGILGYGVDASAHRGVEKIWPFLDRAYPLEEALGLECLPPSVRSSEPFLRAHRLHHFSIVAADFARGSVNLYFPLRNPMYFTPEKLAEIVASAGFGPVPAPMHPMLGQAVFANLTFDWNHPGPTRVCYYLAAPHPELVPPDPLFDRIKAEAPMRGARQFIVGPTWLKGGRYTKLEIDYTGDVLDVFGAALLVEPTQPDDIELRLRDRALAGRAPKPIPGSFSGLATDDEEIREAVSGDFGGLRTESPAVVIRPDSVADVAEALRWAHRRDLALSARGRTHCTFGQAATSGVQVDLRTLDEVGPVEGHRIRVGAGATWRQVCAATLPGLVPPVMPDYLDLTVGGVLSAGGVGGRSHTHGLATDHVTELRVVTGRGETKVCSPTVEPELFWACLGGQGQVAVICEVELALVPAEPVAFVHNLPFPSVAAGVAAMRELVGRPEIVSIEAQVVVEGGLMAGFAPPDVAVLVEVVAHRPLDPKALPHPGPLPDPEPVPFLAYIQRVSALEEELRAMGGWSGPSPWLDVFVPDGAVDGFLDRALPEGQRAGVGPGVVLLYPVRPSAGPRGATPLPDGELCWLFDLLRFSPPDDPMGDAQVVSNEAIFGQALEVGGTLYPIGALRVSAAQWQAQYGPRWTDLVAAKRTHDPRGLLARGQQISAALMTADE